MRKKKNHDRIVDDTLQMLSVSMEMLFTTAVSWCMEIPQKDAKDMGKNLLDAFMVTDVIPEWMIDEFCLPILTGKIKSEDRKGGGFYLYEVEGA